jgi:hypothetical protein
LVFLITGTVFSEGDQLIGSATVNGSAEVAALEGEKNMTASSKEDICGDANGNGTVNIADASYLVNYLFLGGPPPEPMWTGDVDCDYMVGIPDLVRYIDVILDGNGDFECCQWTDE